MPLTGMENMLPIIMKLTVPAGRPSKLRHLASFSLSPVSSDGEGQEFVAQVSYVKNLSVNIFMSILFTDKF